MNHWSDSGGIFRKMYLSKWAPQSNRKLTYVRLQTDFPRSHHIMVLDESTYTCKCTLTHLTPGDIQAGMSRVGGALFVDGVAGVLGFLTGWGSKHQT